MMTTADIKISYHSTDFKMKFAKYTSIYHRYSENSREKIQDREEQCMGIHDVIIPAYQGVINTNNGVYHG